MEIDYASLFPRLLHAIKTSVETDVTRRREYLKQYANVERAMSQLPLILPDYMLVFAVPVLTHDPNFTDPTSVPQLRVIEKCLWLILEPLVSHKDYFCFGFYKNLIDRMKNHKDALRSECELTNHVSTHACIFIEFDK